MSPDEITKRIKQNANELGFQLCGICPAISPPGAARLDEWLAAGYGGQMHYIADRREAYVDPKHVLEGVQSLVMLGMMYHGTGESVPTTGTVGRVARYAQGTVDYHNVIRERLHSLADSLREMAPKATTRGVVDTAPLLEREFAQMAGLGWAGKNTLLLSRHAGSYFFLAALLTDATLEYDKPFEADHCGTCTACLDACPTDAFPQPYVLDASRCISYLTIELRDAVPSELREGIGDWVFGCDVCQEVCPWNRDVPLSEEPNFAPQSELNPLELPPLFEMDESDFRQRFRHTPLWRAHRRGLLRSAAIVLGNQRDPEALPALMKGLNDEEPLVRGAAAWALGQFDIAEARLQLLNRQQRESDESVLMEIQHSLGHKLNKNQP
ncbi:tRNA epoxyqueuosine(34) reductase QueG [Bythopirellula goksoeyrii]|uniref:Epoxyqueuosine reductase n=1 Tax=Bythopirellula goksoeyrii TaxID=1400387 RepID=A0A5B9QND4_9BACT|nr:tRNA epoxyqueuosine(34) reductase QueG [Bythopirellula goksoeyrii]QEG35631.1 Epoxyqueuosine reductase [Bythopirellula goksoeyrii]